MVSFNHSMEFKNKKESQESLIYISINIVYDSSNTHVEYLNIFIFGPSLRVINGVWKDTRKKIDGEHIVPLRYQFSQFINNKTDDSVPLLCERKKRHCRDNKWNNFNHICRNYSAWNYLFAKTRTKLSRYNKLICRWFIICYSNILFGRMAKRFKIAFQPHASRFLMTSRRGPRCENENHTRTLSIAGSW